MSSEEGGIAKRGPIAPRAENWCAQVRQTAAGPKVPPVRKANNRQDAPRSPKFALFRPMFPPIRNGRVRGPIRRFKAIQRLA
jgi:hypothetical protein